MSKNTEHQLCLPLSFDPNLTNERSLICICGHYINCHLEGGFGLSPCQEDDGFCGCMFPEIDIGEIVRETYFYKSAGKIAVDMFYSTQDFSRYQYLSSGGFPALIETRAIPISSEINSENYRDFVVCHHAIKGSEVRKL